MNRGYLELADDMEASSRRWAAQGNAEMALYACEEAWRYRELAAVMPVIGPDDDTVDLEEYREPVGSGPAAKPSD